jgi:hypothetical protein
MKSESLRQGSLMKSFSLASFVCGICFASTLVCCGQAQPNTNPQDGYTLPQPPPPFKGIIGTTYKDSTPDKITVVNPPKGAPNVLMILIDDAGYGQWGTFGGQVPTPNLDRLAKSGLSYLRFHTTALCSPTRAALLTGRNHHSVGMGVITEMADG